MLWLAPTIQTKFNNNYRRKGFTTSGAAANTTAATASGFDIEIGSDDLASSAAGTPTTATADGSGGGTTAREQRQIMSSAKLRQHSLSSVRKLQELLHECNAQLATFRNSILAIGTPADGHQLRKEIDNSARACIRSCETTKNCVLPQLKHEGVEFTRHASQFIGCVSACVVEMKRCEALEGTFPIGDASITGPHIENMESMLETLENLITVHFSTNEAVPADKVTPRRRRGGTCRPQCVSCSKIKTSYA